MDVRLPQLAEGVESGTVVNILVSEGQEIQKDQAFMELETQKAVGSIPSPASGTVSKIHVKEGMEVSVGQVLISISTEKGSTTTASSAVTATVQPKSQEAPPPRQRQETGDGDLRMMADYRYESQAGAPPDRKSTRLNSSHSSISYAVFCLKKKTQKNNKQEM